MALILNNLKMSILGWIELVKSHLNIHLILQILVDHELYSWVRALDISFTILYLFQRAVRESISSAIENKRIDNSKEQVDLFCLRILAVGSISAASAACRAAVVMAFGKSNLVSFFFCHLYYGLINGLMI